MNRMFLVLGFGRSGTGYMSGLLRAFGYDVGHEVMGGNGTSCWAWSTFDPNPPWAPADLRRSQFTFTDVLHVIRHPLQVIESSMYSRASAHEYRAKYTLQCDSLERLDNIALSYLTWFHIIEAQRPHATFRVEDAVSKLSEYLQQPASFKPPNNRYNCSWQKSRDRTPITDFDPLIRDMLAEFCERWNYDVEDYDNFEQPSVLSRPKEMER